VSSLREIYENDKSTYYEYNSGVRKGYKKTIFIQLITAFILCFFFSDITKDFLGSLLAFFSILTGFSFSVLFYIVAGGTYSLRAKTSLLEKANDLEKLNILRKEVFHNVSYFSLVSILVCLLAIFHYFLETRSCHWVCKFLTVEFDTKNLEVFVSFGESLFSFILFFFISNCLYSFVRIIRRVNLLFTLKLDLDAV